MGAVTGVVVLLVPVLALAALAVWYCSVAQTRRHRALEVVTWLQAGLAGRGRVVGTRWQGATELLASLDLESHRLYSASAHVRLGGPRCLDLLTLCCDLDYPPSFEIEVTCERWKLVPADAPPNFGEGPHVQTRRLGVYVVTAEQRVTENYRELMRSLLNSRQLRVERLRLRPVSPHLELSLNLNFTSPPPPGPLFRLLQRLAQVAPQYSR